MIPLERRLCRYGAGACIPGCIGGFIDNGKGTNSINDLENDIGESQTPDGDKARERIANRMKRVEQLEETLGKRRRHVPPCLRKASV